MKRQHLYLCLAAFLAISTQASSQPAPSDDVIEALRAGGHVLIMRHAQSPRQPPSAETASPGNAELERQLDEVGRKSAAEMGDAVRTLRIPIGPVLSSPTYRALETARLAGFEDPQPTAELGDRGEGNRGAWLREKAAVEVPADSNVLLITHAPNIGSAFGEQAAGMADGETLVIRPSGAGDVTIVTRITIDRWPALAAGQ